MNRLILIDEDNLHGRLMRYIISPLFEKISFTFIWERLDNNLFEILRKYENAINDVFCIPLSWETNDYNEIIIKIAKRNKIFAPFDEENQYPWSLDNVEKIYTSISLDLNIGNSNITFSGTSPACALAALSEIKK